MVVRLLVRLLNRVLARLLVQRLIRLLIQSQISKSPHPQSSLSAFRLVLWVLQHARRQIARRTFCIVWAILWSTQPAM